MASKVCALAECSQTAAAEIKQLADASTGIAEQAGNQLMLLIPDIQRTAESVQEISASSKEQMSGANQINSAIQQLDWRTQQHNLTSEGMAVTA